jgi:hypothetical protein
VQSSSRSELTWTAYKGEEPSTQLTVTGSTNQSKEEKKRKKKEEKGQKYKAGFQSKASHG